MFHGPIRATPRQSSHRAVSYPIVCSAWQPAHRVLLTRGLEPGTTLIGGLRDLHPPIRVQARRAQRERGRGLQPSRRQGGRSGARPALCPRPAGPRCSALRGRAPPRMRRGRGGRCELRPASDHGARWTHRLRDGRAERTTTHRRGWEQRRVQERREGAEVREGPPRAGGSRPGGSYPPPPSSAPLRSRPRAPRHPSPSAALADARSVIPSAYALRGSDVGAMGATLTG